MPNKVGGHNIMKNKGKYEHLKEEWIELYRKGWSYEDLSKRYSVNMKTIARYIGGFTKTFNRQARIDLADKLVELTNNKDLTYKDISSLTGMTQSAICKLIKDKKIPHSEKMKKRYGESWIRLYNDGYGISEISNMFNVDRGLVSKVVREAVEVKDKREKYSHLSKMWKNLYESGFTIYDIDRIFNVGDATIRRYLHKEGTNIRSKGSKRSQEKIDSINNFINILLGSD